MGNGATSLPVLPRNGCYETVQCNEFIDNSVDVWTRIELGSSDGRSGHTTAECMGKAFSFGGVKGVGMGEVCDKLKIMNLKSTGLNVEPWETVDFASSSPGCRASQAMCSDGNYIYLIGGINENRQVTSQMHALNCHRMSWTRLNFRDPVAERALCLYGQSLLHFKGSLYSFGGCNELGNYWNDTFKYDIHNSQWSFLRARGTRPSPRNRSSSFICSSGGNNSLYIIGGGSYRPKEDRIDTFKLDMQTLIWKRVKTHGNIPFSRFAFGSAYDDASQKFFMFGGHTKWYHRLGDLQCLDMDSLCWRHIRTEYGPCPRAFHVCFLYQGRFFIFGGTDGEKRINDTWIFDVTAICENGGHAISTPPGSP